MSAACSFLTADQAFSPFFVAAFAVALVLLFLEGRRRRWPSSSWLVLVATVVTLGIIGSRLGAISVADWRVALAHGALPTTTGKTFIGLIILGTAGVLLIHRFLGFRTTVADAFALALPVGMALARIGCTLGGCCFGKPTGLPWAITYPSGSLAATVHELRGLALPGHPALPVHPVQLYEIGLLAIVVLALIRARRSFRRPGSLFLLYLVLHGWVRFMIEFVREGAPVQTICGLRPLQAGLLVFCAGCAAMLVLREKGRFGPQPAPVASPGRNVAVLGALVALLWVFRGWFTPMEQFVLAGACLPAGFAAALELVRSTGRQWSRRVALAAASASVILVGAGSDTLPAPDIGRLSYTDVTLSGGTGSYQEICGGIYRYDQAGIGISHTQRWGQFNRMRFGIQGFRYSEVYADYYPGRTTSVAYVIRPFVGAEFRWAGLEGGAMFAPGDPNGQMGLLPSGRLRLGPSDIVYAEAAVFAQEIGERPMLQLGVGSSHLDRASLHVGICDEGFYFAPEIRTNFGLRLSPFVSYGDRDVWQLSLRLSYSFKDFTFEPVRLGEY